MIGYVGVDVPIELLGSDYTRLAPLDGIDTAFADRVLGRGVDEPTRQILAGLLENAYGVDEVVLCHDNEHTVRLYTSLRALGSEVHFVDLLHLRRESTLAYNRRRLQELASRLGTTPQIAAANRIRDRVAELGVLRRQGRVRSVEALACVRDPLREPELTQSDGKRVFMLGSGHARPDVYAEIDARGWVVVGEDHSWGESVYAGRVDEDGDPLDALARHYTPRRTSSPDGAELALVWIREGDEALAWSIPKWRRELDIPLEVMQ